MNIEHRQTATELDQTYNSSFHRLLKMFTLSVLVSFMGTLAGMEFVPPSLFLPLIFVQLGMMIFAFFIRKRAKPIGYAFVYSFCFITGIILFPIIASYSAAGGAGLINTAFVLTVVIFAGLTMYAYYSKRDFSFLGGALMIGLVTLIGFGLVGMFFGGINSGPVGFLIAIGGVLVFSGFILYDISRYKHGLADEQIPLAVLSLYLNFINLFLYLLRLLSNR